MTANGLEAQWQATENALPEGWEIADICRVHPMNGDKPYWNAELRRLENGLWTDQYLASYVEGQGESPAAALRSATEQASARSTAASAP